MGLQTTKSPKPSEYDSNEDKLSPEFGLNYARYIDAQHYQTENFLNGQKRLIENEAYRTGSQTNENVKKYLLNGRDKSFGKYNFEPLNIIPKYTKVAKKSQNLHLFNPRCSAIDNTSVEDRQNKRNELVDAMINQRFAQRQSMVTGIDFMPKGFIPSSDEDIDVFMDTENILPQEAAMEQALSAVREANNFEEIKDRLADDVLSYGKCVVRDNYDPELGVVVERVYPVEYQQSYDGSEMNDNRKIFYASHAEMVSLVDLHSRYGMETSKCLSWYTGYRGQRQKLSEKVNNRAKWEDINSSMVRVMFFEFRTTLTETWKKKTRSNGTISVTKVDNSYNFNKGNIETIKETKEVWVEGAWIVDSNILLNYGVRNNMVQDSLKKVRCSYTCYDTNETPLVRKMIPHSDNMNLYVIKINQMVAAARPKGVAINLSALLSVPKPDAKDGMMSYLQLIEMFNETGNQVYRLDEFSAGQSIPITELNNGLPADIGKYIDLYNHSLEQINNLTGINPQMAGMGAVSRVSAQSNELALQSSIKSIEFLKDAVLSVEKRLSENIIIRIQDIDRFDRPFKKYVQALGVHNMEALNALDRLHPYTFSLYIEMLPDEDEKRELREDLTLAFQAGDITVVDKMEVNQINNLKWASALLKRKIKENQEKKHQQQLELTQAGQQANMAKLEADNQALQLEYSLKGNLSYQEHMQTMDQLALQLQIKQQAQAEEAARQTQKDMLNRETTKEIAAFKENKADGRKMMGIEAIEKGKADKDTLKNMKK